MNRVTQLSTVAFLTLSLSACFGDKQPPRHNFVEGGKRLPALNQMTANPTVPYPTDEMLYAPVQNPPPLPPEGAMAGAPAVVDASGVVIPVPTQPMAAAPAMPPLAPASMDATMPSAAPANAALEPSPLYYYEQQKQQQAVSATPLAPVSPVATQEIPTQPAQPIARITEDSFTPLESLEPLEPSPLATASNTEKAVVAPAPKETAVVVPSEVDTTSETEVSIKEGGDGATIAYPSLRDVPEKQAPVNDAFAQAKQDAEAFHAEQPSLAIVPTEEVVPEIAPPAVKEEVVVKEKEEPAQEAVVMPTVTTDTPAATESVAEPALVASPAKGEVYHEQTLDEVLAKEVVEDAAKQAESAPITSEMQANPPASALPLVNAPIDYSQQPLPVKQEEVAQEPVAPLEEKMESIPASAPTPAPVATVPFAEDDPEAQKAFESLPDAPVVLSEPAPQPVAVEPAPPVASAPQTPRIYTSSGVIELTPPPSMRSRQELPASRYYERRQRQGDRQRHLAQ